MSSNLTILLIVLCRSISGVAAIISGVYLILHEHGTAGGWCIAAGIGLCWIGYSNEITADKGDQHE